MSEEKLTIGHYATHPAFHDSPQQSVTLTTMNDPKEWADTITRLTAELAAKQEKVERLKQYAEHHINCLRHPEHVLRYRNRACNCGLDELLKE